MRKVRVVVDTAVCVCVCVCACARACMRDWEEENI